MIICLSNHLLYYLRNLDLCMYAILVSDHLAFISPFRNTLDLTELSPRSSSSVGLS